SKDLQLWSLVYKWMARETHRRHTIGILRGKRSCHCVAFNDSFKRLAVHGPRVFYRAGDTSLKESLLSRASRR
ncbi:MAG: hypothetical protein KKA28_17160, partial [Planctomycetes bacterium]|nr:hypothetical protein [Planctomycetota bacterium]